jgi:hypothetical protein
MSSHATEPRSLPPLAALGPAAARLVHAALPNSKRRDGLGHHETASRSNVSAGPSSGGSSNGHDTGHEARQPARPRQPATTSPSTRPDLPQRGALLAVNGRLDGVHARAGLQGWCTRARTHGTCCRLPLYAQTSLASHPPARPYLPLLLHKARFLVHRDAWSQAGTAGLRKSACGT